MKVAANQVVMVVVVVVVAKLFRHRHSVLDGGDGCFKGGGYD